MPSAITIILIVAAILFMAAAYDKGKADGGSALRRKIWIRVGAILVLVSVIVLFSASM